MQYERNSSGDLGERRTTPLLPAQQSIWFFEKLFPGTATYTVARAFRLEGYLNVDALRSAIKGVMRAHAALRVRVLEIEHIPVQFASCPSDAPLEAIELSPLTSDEELLARINCLVNEPFDLANPDAGLCCFKLLRSSDAAHVLIFKIHHLLVDDQSVRIVLAEVSERYERLVNGGDDQDGTDGCETDEAPVFEWSTNELAEGLSFWKDGLIDAPSCLSLPSDRPRPSVPGFAGHTLRLSLPEEIVAGVRRLCASESTTAHTVLVALAGEFLHRWSGQDDIVLGTTVSLRMEGSLLSAVGALVNTVPVRLVRDRGVTLRQAIARVRNTLLDAYENGRVPFSSIVKAVNPARDPAINPIFQALVAFSDKSDDEFSLANVHIEQIRCHSSTSKYDIAFYFEADATRLNLSIEYSTDLFDARSIERMWNNALCLFASAVRNPDGELERQEWIAADEIELIKGWEKGAAADPVTQTVIELFERQADAKPTDPAVRFEGKEISYGELRERSNLLVSVLTRAGVTRGSVVGVLLERGPDVVSALLAILKCGAAYLPLDPGYPPDRLKYMIDDAHAHFVISDRARVDGIDDDRIIEVGALERLPDLGPTIERAPNMGDLAYVIYTSGSTGRPKGVMISHLGLANVVSAFSSLLPMERTDVFAFTTSVSFDISVLEILLPLSVGAIVAIAPRAVILDPDEFHQWIEGNGVTIIQATPGAWRLLLSHGRRSRRPTKNISGGEAVSEQLASLVAEEAIGSWNGYGPTETAIYSTVTPMTSRPLSIGRPICNTFAYVLDRYLSRVPMGVVGELCIGGMGVGRGYLGKPGLTAERFVANPFERGQRIYRTGDLAKHLPDGRLAYIGRADSQIKMRGYRIELGEIERVLEGHEAVSQAVVVVRGSERGAEHLVGYVVVKPEAKADKRELAEHLQRLLPEFMVPAAIVIIARFPLTPNGKIDRAALPDVQRKVGIVEQMSPLESIVFAAWTNVLKLEDISLDENFFALGGSSLSLSMVGSSLKKAIGVEITTLSLFQNPTIRSCARSLLSAVQADRPARTETDGRQKVLANRRMGKFM